VILIVRGLPQEGEATRLAAIEGREVARVRDLIVREGREPSSDEIGTLYRCAGDLLYRRQGRKCAYCERCEERRRNDVEHFRPKARANRLPGSALTHGYWWLAWRWDNLLFACAVCNRSWTKDWFPLEDDTHALQPGDPPPGRERPGDPFGRAAVLAAGEAVRE
jgi:5-methylcytosine-specific restriction endonuclease McrA